MRAVVRGALQAAGASDAEIRLAVKETGEIYEARSRLSHEGDIDPAMLSRCYQLALKLLQRILRSRLSTRTS